MEPGHPRGIKDRGRDPKISTAVPNSIEDQKAKERVVAFHFYGGFFSSDSSGRGKCILC